MLFCNQKQAVKLIYFAAIVVSYRIIFCDINTHFTTFQAIGEPPLCLAASVFYAIKNAIVAAREDNGLSGHFRLDSPATCERIRMACEDRFTKQVSGF